MEITLKKINFKNVVAVGFGLALGKELYFMANKIVMSVLDKCVNKIEKKYKEESSNENE